MRGKGRRRYAVLTVIVSVVGLMLAPAAMAAPGDLDPGFGSGGLVTNAVGSGVDVAAQADGKLVTVGSQGECSEVGGEQVCTSEFLVERYNDNGTLDSSFGGGDGIAGADFGTDSAGAGAVIIEASGKLLVGGITYDDATEENEFALARFNADGTLDSSFGGGDGTVTAAVTGTGIEGLRSWSGSMALLPGGKVVLGGESFVHEAEFNATWHMVLAGFTASGSVDSSFGTGGIVIGPPGDVFGLTADSAGRVLAAGRAGSAEFAVARFAGSGALDSSFGGGDGIATMALSLTGSQADDVLVQPDGKILASGFGYGYAVARFNEDGTPDTTFGGGDGVVMTFFGQPCCALAAAISVARQADGRIVFAGQMTPDEDSLDDEWGIGRLYANGAPDKSFGNGGLVTNNIEGSASSGNDASGVAIQPDGKIVAVGTSGDPNFDFSLLRLLGGGSAPPPSYQHLLIAKSGSGNGQVNGPELNCFEVGGNCAVDYEAGRTVSISAFAEFGSSFTGWTTSGGDPGSCTGTTSPCEVTLSSAVDLVAHFSQEAGPTMRQLEVSTGGPGTGTVTSSPAGINCSVFCEAEFADGSVVTLTATPAPGSVFAGWSGTSCPGMGPCQLTMSGDRSVTATFVASTPGGGGQGEQPALPAVTLPLASLPKAGKAKKPLHCRKGFKKKRVKGKVKCVKVKHPASRALRVRQFEKSGASAWDLSQECLGVGLARPVMVHWPTMYHAGIRPLTPQHLPGQYIRGEFEFPALPEACVTDYLRVAGGQLQMQKRHDRRVWVNNGPRLNPSYQGNEAGRSQLDYGPSHPWPAWLFNQCEDGKDWLKVRDVLTVRLKDRQSREVVGKAIYSLPVKVRGNCRAAAVSARLTKGWPIE